MYLFNMIHSILYYMYKLMLLNTLNISCACFGILNEFYTTVDYNVITLKAEMHMCYVIKIHLSPKTAAF